MANTERKQRREEKKRTKRMEKAERTERRRQGGIHAVLVHAMSKMRLSLTFRIAIHYCGQLLRTMLLSAVIMSICLGVICGLSMDGMLNRIKTSLPDAEDGVTYTQQILQNQYAAAVWIPDSSTEDHRQFATDPVMDNVQSLKHFSLTLRASSSISAGTIIVTYDIRSFCAAWLLMMLALIACDALRMLFFVRHHSGLNKRVLAPIHDITELAATLSANNLSNRINIAGTKNELKDLASVINTMLDRIERSYNSQKQFVSDASHELRTPIAVIQGYVSMLQRWGKDDRTVLDESLEAISQEAASMKDLVENLLFLARHDKKTLMLEMETFDPCDIVQELHREAAMVTPEDQFELAATEHTTIEADRNMIKQVMRILLDNAVKYTPKGGTISMGVYNNGNGVTLMMKDNGPGIPGDELPKIFDRFYRSDSARKAENGGHGLGLSIARIIVVAHGGKIRVRSKVGEGTVFSVILPLTQGKGSEIAEEQQEPESNQQAKNQSKLKKRRKAAKVA